MNIVEENNLKAQDKIIEELRGEITKYQKLLNETKKRRAEIASHKIKVGDRVKLLIDVMDAYHEVYFSKGEIVTIKEIHPEQVGYEYCISGFCIGRDDFEKFFKRK